MVWRRFQVANFFAGIRIIPVRWYSISRKHSRPHLTSLRLWDRKCQYHSYWKNWNSDKQEVKSVCIWENFYSLSSLTAGRESISSFREHSYIHLVKVQDFEVWSRIGTIMAAQLSAGKKFLGNTLQLYWGCFFTALCFKAAKFSPTRFYSVFVSYVLLMTTCY